ncbi:MAG TPA: enolase C-terminal domain-like protein [Acidimicrobiales bacterium]|nr:enolase C-terminal domain-like protein [Acidimicrobiales bacterium]
MTQPGEPPRTEDVVDSIDCRVFTVPTDQPEADGTLAWSDTTVVVTCIRAGATTGTGWTYASAASKSIVDTLLAPVVLRSRVWEISATHEQMVRACRNVGRQGAAGCAISAVDIALWDLKARMLEVGLPRLVGGESPTRLYGSGGFTTYDDRALAQQLDHFVADLGMSGVKIKIGESWGTQVGRDLARVAESRRVVGDAIELYVDANGGYRRKQSIRIGQEMSAEHGVVWFEEPVSSDDLAGLRQVRESVPMDVAAGEYGFDEVYFARMIESESVDCLQIDATRCGGYTSWLQAAALAAAHNLDVSAHCAPHLHAQVAAAAPNLRHVEYFHDHARVDHALFDGLPIVGNGLCARDDDSPGHGMVLKESDAERYRVV